MTKWPLPSRPRKTRTAENPDRFKPEAKCYEQEFKFQWRKENEGQGIREGVSQTLSGGGEIHRERWHQAGQNLARSQRQGTKAPVRSAHGGSLAPVEAQSDGSAFAQQVVRVFARPGLDAQRHGHGMGTVAHPA